MEAGIECCEGSKETAISAAMSQLDTAICQNSEAVGELVARLRPVLLAETPPPVNEKATEESPERCDIEHRIRAAIGCINQQKEQVRHALGRLQL